MDGGEIDAWARALAAGASRRAVLKGIGGGVIGGLVALFGRRPAEIAAQTCQETGEGCERDVDCCSGLCGPSGCFEPEPICSGEGEICGFSEGRDTFFNCCEGLHCNGSVCMPPRPSCVGEGEACGGLGGDGLVECCEGANCVDGVCQVETGGVCGVLGDGCATPDDCCAGLTCFEALCDNPSGLCTGAGEYCDGSVPCCDDLVCADAACSAPDQESDVTTLPDTGVGGVQPDSPQWTPLALGGAAALVAGNLLRRRRNTEA